MPYIGRGPGFGVRSRFIYTATANQTSFSGNDGAGITLAYTDTLYLDVYQNGVLLVPATDYAATTGTSVVLVQGASADDTVEMVVYDIFSVADAVSAKDGGTFNGAISVTGKITADAGIDIDNFNIDGTTIALSSGNLTLDVAGNIDLDADGGQVSISDGGVEIGYLYNSSSDFIIQSAVSDKDIKIQGNDGGSTVTALTLDMSAAGRANFGNDIGLSDNRAIRLGTGDDSAIFNDGSNLYIKNATSNQDIIFQGNDDGSANLTVLTLDMSNAGQAAFNKGATFGASVTAETDTDTSNSGNVTLDYAAHQNFVLTLTGNTTLVNPTTEVVGQSGFISFIQDGTGSRVLSVGNQYFCAGGAVIVLSTAANSIDIVPYVVIAAGKVCLGAPQLAFADAS